MVMKDTFEDCHIEPGGSEKDGNKAEVMLNGYHIWWCYTHNQPLAWCEKEFVKQKK